MPPWITSLLRDDTPLPMPLGRLGDDHLVALERRRARDRKPHHAGADDEDLHQSCSLSVAATKRHRHERPVNNSHAN